MEDEEKRRTRDEQEAFIRLFEDSSISPMVPSFPRVVLPQFVPMAKKRRVAAAISPSRVQ
jgi:hypothetical protein